MVNDYNSNTLFADWLVIFLVTENDFLFYWLKKNYFS